MRDLTHPRLLYIKASLFLLAGLLASAALLLQSPTLQTALLITLVAWCFARFYYFAFYVIQKYIDPTYRFAGLFSAARFLLRRH